MAICPGTTAPTMLVDAPAVEPYKYGAITAYDVIDSPDPHVFNGISYKPYACDADVAEFIDVCPPASPTNKAPTDLLLQDNEVVGCPFHLYAYLSCKETTLDAMFDEAREVFRFAEQRGVEEQVWNRLLSEPDTVVLNDSELTADAVDFLQGIALLESNIAFAYPGQATLHADRGVYAHFATNMLLMRENGGLFTPVDSRIALYSGAPNTSPTGVAAADGYAWLYATSNVTLRRSEIDVFPEDAGHILTITPGGFTNQPKVIAERTYVPSVECAKFAVQVCIGSTCTVA